MMNYSNEFYQWINDALLMLGVLLIPVGLAFCLCPKKMFELAIKMNKWVATDHIFHKINKPIYKESFFYRHHQIFGMIVIIVSIASLYTLIFYNGTGPAVHALIKVAETEFEKWLFVVLYFILLAAISLAILFGAIMCVRPSALKQFEKWSNQWIDTDGPLKALDKQNNLPDSILPGNPRIFGLFIILGAVYIIWCTYPH
jgi:hypothetical protein